MQCYTNYCTPICEVASFVIIHWMLWIKYALWSNPIYRNMIYNLPLKLESIRNQEWLLILNQSLIGTFASKVYVLEWQGKRVPRWQSALFYDECRIPPDRMICHLCIITQGLSGWHTTAACNYCSASTTAFTWAKTTIRAANKVSYIWHKWTLY